LIIIIGTTYPELGGSVYLAALIEKAIASQGQRGFCKMDILSMQRAMKAGIISSCHDVSDGGIGCALAESAFAGGYGAEIGLTSVPAKAIFRDDLLLFSESQSRFIITIKEKDLARFQNIFKHCPYGIIGKVRPDSGL
jgi:phosphoribosylformylglycinamidine synthase